MSTSSITRLFAVFFLSFASACAIGNPLNIIDTQQVVKVGWLEQVKLGPNNLVMHAKLDTGADSCSVHAENMSIRNKKKGSYVSFTMSNRYGEKKRLKRRVIRWTKIKKKEGGTQRRPVIRIKICVENSLEAIECNLVDRSHFSYPVLIGRDFLAGSYLVDSGDTYTTQPNCKTAKKKNTKS